MTMNTYIRIGREDLKRLQMGNHISFEDGFGGLVVVECTQDLSDYYTEEVGE